MGSGTSIIIDPVRVSRTKGKYPPPQPPKWFLPDIRPLFRASETVDPNIRNIDWDALEHFLEEVDDDDGIDTNKDTVRIRPSSGIGTARTDSGLKKFRHTKRHGQKPVLSFEEIDKHAKAALPNHSLTFEALVSYLKQPIDEMLYPDTCLVRALTVWFSKQDTKKLKYRHADPTTPQGIIQHLRQQTLSFTGAYTLICRGARVPAVIITGVVKAGKYEPGDVIDDDARDSWCAVHVDGSWQLVHPHWVCRGTYGKERDGWVQIEEDPFLAEIMTRREKDKNAVTINEEFFMPKPDVFIYRCYADDAQWHLIPQGKTLKSVEEFTNLVYISPPFFKFGLTLASNPYSVQYSVNGKVTIEIIAPKDHIHVLNLGYRIHAEETDNQTTSRNSKLLQENILSRFVINYRSNDRFVFEIRLPLEGSYRLIITGGFGKQLCHLCRFKLICTESLSEWFIAPVHPGNDGWGPGPIAEKAGLLLPTKPSGLLTVGSRQNSGMTRRSTPMFYHLVTLNFQINRALIRKYEYTVEIVPSIFVEKRNIESHFTGNGELKDEYQMKQKKAKPEQEEHVFPVRAQCVKDFPSRQFTVQVIGNLVAEECAVLIKATEMEIMNNIRKPKKETTKVVCYYLLSNTTSFYNREPTEVKLCKMELHDAMNTTDVYKIQAAMDKCLKFKVPITDDAIAAAEARIEYLTLKADIIDCVKRRNIAIVNETIGRVVNYRYREALAVEVDKLLEFRHELLGLHGYTQGLPALRDANEELYKLTSPTPPVHNTMKALCILLGYEGNLKDWKYIHKHLKVTPDTLSEMVILKRMEYMSDRSFPWRNMEYKTLQRVYKIVHAYPFEHVQHVSLAAAAIYKWIDTMLNHAKQVLRNQTE